MFWRVNGGKLKQPTARDFRLQRSPKSRQLSRGPSESGSFIFHSSSRCRRQPFMFRKSVSRAVLPRALHHPQRAFSTSLPVRRLVATNSVKADVNVYLPCLFFFRYPNVSLFLIVLVFRQISSHRARIRCYRRVSSIPDQ